MHNWSVRLVQSQCCMRIAVGRWPVPWMLANAEEVGVRVVWREGGGAAWAFEGRYGCHGNESSILSRTIICGSAENRKA